MVETFFGFKKPAFGDNPDAKQLFASQAWTQVKARLQFLVDHHGAGLLTGTELSKFLRWVMGWPQDVSPSENDDGDIMFDVDA